MKIAFLRHNLAPWDLELYRYIQSTYDIHFDIYLRGEAPGTYQKMYKSDGYSQAIIDSFKIYNWGKLNPKKYDIVECLESQYLHSLYGKLLSRLAGVPFVIRVYENIARYRRMPSLLFHEHRLTKTRFFMKTVEKNCHIISCTNNAKYDLVYRGVPEEKISVVYPGVDINKFRFRNKINYNKLVYVGRLVREKGTNILEKAKESLGYELCLINSRAYGSIQEVYDGIFCMLSEPLLTWEEQYGFSLVQAMMSGNICIVSNSGALPEVVGPYGYIVPFRSYERFAETLKLIESKSIEQKEEERRKIAEFARKNYGLEVSGRKMVDVYKKIVR